MKNPEIVLELIDDKLVHISTNGMPINIIILNRDKIVSGEQPLPNKDSLYEPDYIFDDLSKQLKEYY